jgi:hypothetical protein
MSRPTFFHIGGIMMLIYAIPMLCYSAILRNDGGLDGFFYIEFIFFGLVILLIDLLIPKRVNILIVNFTEVLLLIGVFCIVRNL